MSGDGKAYELFTLDHEDGSLRLDLAHTWADAAAPQPTLHEEALLCDPNSVSSDTAYQFFWCCTSSCTGQMSWCHVATPAALPREEEMLLCNPKSVRTFRSPVSCGMWSCGASGSPVESAVEAPPAADE